MTAVEPDVALAAREALAVTNSGTLHIHGVGALGPDGADVLFYDDDGRPTFLTPPNSPVAVAATRRRAAALAVPMDGSTNGAVAGSTDRSTTTLVLAGHLAAVGTEDVDGETVHVVGLLVHSVVLERDHPDSPTLVQQEIPLADWTTARPDPIRRTAQRILRHTNESHARELRAFVASLRAIPEADIVAATLAELDHTGVDVRWLDARGAHTTHVRFPVPASCPGSLAGLLREMLSGSR